MEVFDNLFNRCKLGHIFQKRSRHFENPLDLKQVLIRWPEMVYLKSVILIGLTTEQYTYLITNNDIRNRVSIFFSICLICLT